MFLLKAVGAGHASRTTKRKNKTLRKMDGNGDIIGLLKLMLEENRETNRRLNSIEQRLVNVEQRLVNVEQRLVSLEKRMERVEMAIEQGRIEQQKTNVLLSQHTLDLMKLAEAQRQQADAPRYGDVVELEVLNQTEKAQRVVLRKTQ